MTRLRFTLILACVACVQLGESCADWPQFRGTNSAGVGNGQPPIEFGPSENVRWVVDMDPGHSSPCVVANSIYVTTFDAKKTTLTVISLDKNTGQTRWRRKLKPKRLEKGHPSFNPASSSVACDGKHVVAYFGSYGLVCYTIDGELLWEFKLPITRSYAGNATSPTIIGNRVILYRGNHVDHFLLAVDVSTGKELWRVVQEEPFIGELACTACPISIDNTLIAHTARSVQAFDITTGNQLWVTKCATTATSTPVIVGDEVIVAAWNKMGEPALRPELPSFDSMVAAHDKDKDGTLSRDEFPKMFIFHRPDGAEAPQNGAPVSFKNVDQDKDGEITQTEWSKTRKGLEHFRSRYETHGILAIPIASEGLIDQDKVRTLETQGIPEVPSPIAYDGMLYFVKNGGVLTSLDLETGDRLSRIRTGGTGTHYASPIRAGDKLFTTAGNGAISVLQLGEQPKVLAVNEMNDNTYATPAIVDGVLYVRTHTKLYAFASE